MSAKKSCPIELTVSVIGRKWILLLIRDMFFGKKHFSDFLKANPALSNKVLASKLKELETLGLIEKKIENSTPLVVSYHLTTKGLALNKIMLELAHYGTSEFANKLEKSVCTPQAFSYLRKNLKL